MDENILKLMHNNMNSAKNYNPAKKQNSKNTQTKVTTKNQKPVQKPKVQSKPKVNHTKPTKPAKDEQNPLHITKTETHSAHVTSNNKTGHMLPWSVQLDVHQIAQLSALEKLLHLKNRSQVEAILLNHRVTVSDIVSKQGKNAKAMYKTFYNSFIFSNKPKAEKQYKKYHNVK